MFSRDYKINKMSENIKSVKVENDKDKNKPFLSYESIRDMWANDENYAKYKKRLSKEKNKEKTNAAKER